MQEGVLGSRPLFSLFPFAYQCRSLFRESPLSTDESSFLFPVIVNSNKVGFNLCQFLQRRHHETSQHVFLPPGWQSVIIFAQPFIGISYFIETVPFHWSQVYNFVHMRIHNKLSLPVLPLQSFLCSPVPQSPGFKVGNLLSYLGYDHL